MSRIEWQRNFSDLEKRKQLTLCLYNQRYSHKSLEEDLINSQNMTKKSAVIPRKPVKIKTQKIKVTLPNFNLESSESHGKTQKKVKRERNKISRPLTRQSELHKVNLHQNDLKSKFKNSKEFRIRNMINPSYIYNKEKSVVLISNKNRNITSTQRDKLSSFGELDPEKLFTLYCKFNRSNSSLIKSFRNKISLYF